MNQSIETQVSSTSRSARQATIAKVVPLLVIIAGFVALALGQPARQSVPAGGGAGPGYQTARATPTVYIPRMTQNAIVTPRPRINAMPAQTGWIREIAVHPGQRVLKGELLALLQPADQSSAQAQATYQSANENLARARLALNDATASLDARQADVVARQADVTSAKTALAAAQSAQARAEADVASANREIQQQTAAVKQAQTFYAQGVSPHSDVENAQTALTQAQNAQKDAAGRVGDAQAKVSSAGSNLATAQATLRQSLAAQAAARRAVVSAQNSVRQNQAAVDKARAALGSARLQELLSPVEGTVEEVLVQPGVLATPTTQIIRITPAAMSTAEFDVSTGQAAQLRAGAPATVLLPRSTNGLPARVQGVFPTANGGQRPYKVIVEVTDPAGLLKPNNQVTVIIPLRQVNAVKIPRTALLLSGTQPAVQVRSGSTTVTQPVTVVGYEGESAIISSGLTPGNEVVITRQPLGEPAPTIPAL